MSALPQDPPAARTRRRSAERLALRLAAFFALAGFVSLRYAALVTAPPAGRIVAIAACATAGCGALALTSRLRRPRALAIALRLLLVLGTFALSALILGLPAHMLAPASWGGLGHHLHLGLHRLDQWLWPYRGDDWWARATVLLVIPAVLAIAGGVCFWPSRSAVATRRAVALAALVGIFVAGAANTPGSLPAIQGLVLLGLIAASLLLPAVPAEETGRAGRWLAAFAVTALIAESALGSMPPWIPYRDGGLAAGASASFQWNQLYGPIRWSRSEATMLTLTEPRPTVLRVTSLDRFDGLRFLRSDSPPGSSRLDLGGPRALRRWSERATVDVAGLRSLLLADGGGVPTAAHWLGAAGGPIRRQADGTIAVGANAPSGALYEVTSYVPRPSAAEARRAPRAYPRAYLPYAEFTLPGGAESALQAPELTADASTMLASHLVVGPRAPGQAPAADPTTAAVIEASPYGPMFALARHIAAGAPSSYDVAVRLERFLQSNYTYDEHVPLTRYPLESFLFEQHRGYCEQFSGAMTLMLRMVGIPARVGVGFQPGGYDSATGTWQVRALDAHAWVEVFFTGIGWVSFDPTPAAPIRPRPGGGAEVSKSLLVGGLVTLHHGAHGTVGGQPVQLGAGHGAGPLGAATSIWALLAALLALGAGVWLAGRSRLRRAFAGDADGAVAELRRALAVLGSSSRAITLARLETQLARGGHTEAGEYVRRIRELRYGRGCSQRPTPTGRAALRRALVESHGLSGRVRALLALPPGWPR
jgi:transglutaminase-like putative cysteine protease